MEFSGAATLLAQPSPKQSALKALLPQSSKPKRIPHPHPKGFGFHYSDGVKSILWSPVTQPTSTSVNCPQTDESLHRFRFSVAQNKIKADRQNEKHSWQNPPDSGGPWNLGDRPPNVNVQVSVPPNELMELDFQ